MNFCETCNNLLVFVNKNSKMVSHCNICNVDNTLLKTDRNLTDN